MKNSTTIEITSDQVNIIEQGEYVVIDFKTSMKKFYTSTESHNELNLHIPETLATKSGVDQLGTVVNQPLEQLELTKDISAHPQITLTIEKVDKNNIVLSLLIMNNSEGHLSLPMVPYKIINDEGSELYKSVLTEGPFEAKPETYSRYIIEIEESSNFDIEMENYQVVFGH